MSASPPVLEWVEVDVPGDNDLTVVTPSEVTGVAAGDNGVVYAIDGENGRIYRSTNYGLDWEDITKYLREADAVLPATKIAVAPDNEGIVAVLADSGTEVYVSLDGGLEWEQTHLPSMAGGEEVTSLALSPVYTDGEEEYRDIAVGTASWGDGFSNGDVYILQGICRWSGWKAQGLYVDPGFVGADVATLSYSSTFRLDGTLLVVCSTGSDVAAAYQHRTWLCPGQRDGQSNLTDWGYFGGSGYPLMISDDGVDPVPGDDNAVSYIRASLAQPDDYASDEVDERALFVSVEREPDGFDDVYRVVGDLPGDVCERMDVDGGGVIDIWSIAYRGDLEGGILLAGEREPFDTFKIEVYRCLNPFDASLDWLESTVPPTGPGHAVLAWAPNVSLAYCGTSSQPGVALDESAFSASTDGDLWRQMGLIDTQFTLCDLVVTPDGEDLFLATSNESGPESIWQSFTDPLGERWERVLTIDSDTDAVMLELSQCFGDDETIYVVEHNGDRIALSHDGGSSWEWQRNSPEPILDVVVVDENTLYAAIADGMVMKSTNHARSWEDAVDAVVDDINMLSLAADGTLFAGSRDGYVSYSMDGAENFVRVEERVGTGDVQVLAGVGYEDGNGWVYAGTDVVDEGLWRSHGLKARDWQQMDGEITVLGDGQRIGGLLQGPEGTLYALRVEPASDDTGGMTRWLCPTCSPCADLEFDHVIDGLPDAVEFDVADVFTTAYSVGTLWSNDAETDIFVIDSSSAGDQEQRIWLYRDTLCKRGPELEAPADGAQLDPNACNCNQDAMVAFDWERLHEADEYQWQVYLDASLSEQLWSELSDYEGIVISPWGGTSEFHSGQRYGWRVRTVAPVLSPWSTLRSFTPVLCPVDNLVPGVAATGIALTPVFTWDSQCTVDSYEFVLSSDPSYSGAIVEFSGPGALNETTWRCDLKLEPSTDYFWRVRSVRGDARSLWVEGHFSTKAEPVTPAPGADSILEVPAQPVDSMELTIWVLFGLVVVLMVTLIILVMKTAARR